MDNMKHRRLQELDRSDFEIVNEEPDIRGWDVKTAQGEKIGEVEELIIDAQEKKVRYMVVDLDDNELKLNHRKILLPIGLAELHEHDDDVLIPRVSWEQLEDLPAYDRDHLTADVERNICSVLDRKTSSTAAEEVSKYQPKATTQPVDVETNKKEKEDKKEKDEVAREFYRHEYYNLDNLYKNRLHEAQPVNNKNETEYERGLKLWERRSEGGILPGETTNEAGGYPTRDSSRREIDEEARMEMVRNRRNNYRQKRYTDDRYEKRNENRKREGMDL
jgi:sporulation protein YlmC with PRC-barrel domain